MPANGSFEFYVEVGGVRLPEYSKAGAFYVESNLFTPYSYKVEMLEVCNGVSHSQGWPTTPYSIVIHHRVSSELPQAYFRVLVDGVKAKAVNLSRGQTRSIDGFKEGTATKEFLFALPHVYSTERLAEERVPHIGRIQVECWRADLRKAVRKARVKRLDYTQAAKADAGIVTQGAYCMSTTRVGRLLKEEDAVKVVNHWRRTTLISSLVLQYHMTQTLLELGFELKPIAFPPVMRLPPAPLLEQKMEIKSESELDTSTVSSSDDRSRTGSDSLGAELTASEGSGAALRPQEARCMAERITGLRMEGSETESLTSVGDVLSPPGLVVDSDVPASERDVIDD